jgi:hypothetical protein
MLAVWIAICAAGAGCGGNTRFGLLPGIRQAGRDPDPTRPLVETQVAPPRAEDGGRPRSVVIGKVDVAVSGAAVLGWLLGGAAPLVGAYGTFDETSWFLRKPGKPAAADDDATRSP